MFCDLWDTRREKLWGKRNGGGMTKWQFLILRTPAHEQPVPDFVFSSCISVNVWCVCVCVRVPLCAYPQCVLIQLVIWWNRRQNEFKSHHCRKLSKCLIYFLLSLSAHIRLHRCTLTVKQDYTTYHKNMKQNVVLLKALCGFKLLLEAAQT